MKLFYMLKNKCALRPLHRRYSQLNYGIIQQYRRTLIPHSLFGHKAGSKGSLLSTKQHCQHNAHRRCYSETASPYKLIILDKNGTMIDFHTRWSPWVQALSDRIESATGKDLKNKIYDTLDVCRFTHKARTGVLGQGTTWDLKLHLEELLETEGYNRRQAQLLVEQNWTDCDPSKDSSLKPVTNLYQLLANLKSGGLKVAVSTSDNRSHTDWVLDKLNLSSLVDMVVCSDDLGGFTSSSHGCSKICHICQTLGIPASQTVIVGDTPNDLIPGKEAKVALKIGVLTGTGSRLDLNPYADLVIDSIATLESIVLRKIVKEEKSLQELQDSLSKSKAALVIFDKDGTLINFDKMWTPFVKDMISRLEEATGLELENKIMDEFGYCSDSERWRPGLLAEGTHGQQQLKVKEVLTEHGYTGNSDKVVEDSWLIPDSSENHVIDDPRVLFKTLKARGVKIAICTADSREPTLEFIEYAGLKDYIDIVVCGDDHGSVPKPSPKNALLICEKLGVDPAEAVVVGDTEADLGMGRSAKLGATVGVLSGIGRVSDLDNKADHIVHSIQDVESLLLPDQEKERNGKHNINSTAFHRMSPTRKKPNHSGTTGYHTWARSLTNLFSPRQFSTRSNNSPSYRYVIVGAGSAGCVLANRLSTDPNNSVLLLEAGPRDKGWKIYMPAALMYNLMNDKYNWFYHTVPQKNMNDRVMYQPRGRVWGGSSSLNAMVYVRGHALDFDRWEDLGATDWSYADCLPYFKKSQTHDDYGEDDYRGGKGPLHVSRGKSNNPLEKAWLDAGVQAGYPYTDDMNGFQQEGFGYMDMTIHNGVRWSAAAGYLHPTLSRPNLHTENNVLASKVLFNENRAVGIEYISNGSVKQAWAEQEVILSGGAINSPQLLMLSGIGNADELNKLGIHVQADIPGVGKNLQDHLDVYMQYKCKQPVTMHKYSTRYPWNRIPVGIQWFLFKKGVCASAHLETGGFIRSRPGIPHPNMQYHFLPSLVLDHGRAMGNCHAYQAHVSPMRQLSTGSVKLKSKDPKDHPLIDFNYLSYEEDKLEMREIVRLTREILNQKAFDEFRGEELQPGPDIQTDIQIDEWIREKADTAYHPSCTCKMGSESDPMSVVNPRLQVKGVDNLRVVDASVMPFITSGNLNAPTVMLAEKAADIILGKPPLPKSSALVYQPDITKQR